MKFRLLRPTRPECVDASMRDWPAQLRLNVIATELAKDIYKRACELRNAQNEEHEPITPFSELPQTLRQQYVFLASNALRHLKTWSHNEPA